MTWERLSKCWVRQAYFSQAVWLALLMLATFEYCTGRPDKATYTLGLSLMFHINAMRAWLGAEHCAAMDVAAQRMAKEVSA